MKVTLTIDLDLSRELALRLLPNVTGNISREEIEPQLLQAKHIYARRARTPEELQHDRDNQSLCR